ncbi:bcl-2-like protein 13 [Betta splendens]|uniref:Bcl-2-like protein 13 n=1 Tax=Betta splendens TaxID=158456 RepID=A0A6P7NBU4_BETSP|nr:bcl-2-like protein 13 [Betta splendens]XP_055367209.1 bcl-2-like protein 13 [Betta splendens]
MGDLDPEDTKSLDSSNEAAVASEENHSSNSDMVHLEQEEVEMLDEEGNVGRAEEEEEDEELQTSVLSVLGGERELVELREEEEEEEEEEDFQDPDMEEEPFLVPTEFRRSVPAMSLPPLPVVKLDPPSTTSTPVPSTTESEVEELYPAQGLLPPSILTPMAAEPVSESLEQLHFSQVPLSDVEEHSVKASEAASGKERPLGSTELLCGGALLVAVVGVVAYGAVAYCRK